MKNKNIFWTYLLIMLGVLMFVHSCKKDATSSKKNPLITWANPADIDFGILLSETQLNATSDVPGTFVYTPAPGTKLNEGANQDLKVDFTPTDLSTYNSVSKTVKINVILVAAPSGGISSAIFNSSKTYGTMSDFDGNVYKTITIGKQTWMAENLRTTKYRYGEAIPEVTDSAAWKNLTTGAYCNFNNIRNADTIATYGRLYNWFAIDDNRSIAPIGWHVPTITEWTTLTNYVGGDDAAGDKLKEPGATHWVFPDTGVDNSSGFTALPGDCRYDDGTFRGTIGGFGYWWSSTEYSSGKAWFLSLSHYNSGLGRFYKNEVVGYSIRCVKDK
jgi:uncharacterized protein (TIGR02145 family)